MKTAIEWTVSVSGTRLLLISLFLLTPFLRAQETDERIVLVPLGKAPKEVPLFFSASVDVKTQVGLEAVTSEQKIQYRIHQGKPETLTLGLSGAGEVLSVTGQGLRDWSVRVADDGARFLDVRPVSGSDDALKELNIQVKTQLKIDKKNASLLLPGPGAATGFAMSIAMTPDDGTDMRVIRADGLMPIDASRGKKFVGYGLAFLELAVGSGGTGSRGMVLMNSDLTGKLAPDGNSISFRLTTIARATAIGSAAELLNGGAALSGNVSGDGWHVVLRTRDGGYDLVAERAGDFPVVIDFVAPVTRRGDWRVIDFNLPAGVVVPLKLEGMGKTVQFDNSFAVVPEQAGEVRRGFLPASGKSALAWREAGTVADGALFFSSTESSDVRIGSGLMRQLTTLDLRVLQGKLANLTISLVGSGEVLAVSGEPVLGWSVVEDAGKRRIDVKLSRPIEGSGRIVIEAQAALGSFPVKVDAFRMAPIGALRHSGWLRVANDGAVRVEVIDAKGLIQLAPGQFPGGVDASLRQVFVYRFPSTDYAYAIQADQVLPEVSVTEVTVYELAETDRRVSANLELDIREAPLREWEMEIPADHAVASVTGAEVADYTVASEVKDGRRRLKIIFNKAVSDRQLINLRLEKNEAAKAGAWDLQSLGFPGVKSRRGYIGAVAAAGYRLVAGKTSGVAEVPITFFPVKTAGLQQAFRLREGIWNANLTVEALGQSIQADVFHLYSLKAGAVYGSVLINYFVVGAPANEWKISVPDGIGNIDVTGQNVGRDWRRDGNTVIVPLSRPVLGTGTVLLTFEQPMSARGGEITPGEVRPLGVQAERGYVQVVSPLQVKFAKPSSEGPLLKIDASELPAEFRLLSTSPTLAAWQYTARDFKIGMKIEWFAAGETVEQVVDFLKLSSQVSRDGQWVTDARFFVKSRGRNVLRTRLPGGARIWEAKVNHESVNARADGAETLIPLPSQLDPNQAVEVTLRYGASAENAKHLHLIAPKLSAPVVIGEWTVTGDEGRQLVPRGGTAELVRAVLTETGWQWCARHSRAVALLVLLGVAALALGFRTSGRLKEVFALLIGLAFVITSVGLGLSAAAGYRGSASVLKYAAPVVAAGGEVAVKIDNVAPWVARMGWGTWLVFALGVTITLCGMSRGDRWWKGCGLALVGASFLSIHGGAALFFLIVSGVALVWWLPQVCRVIRELRKPKVVELTAALMLAFGLLGNQVRAAESTDTKPAESMVHDWKIRDGRLHGTLDVTLRGDAGDRFLLLRTPAVLTGFEGAGLRLVKAPLQGADAYFLIAESAGRKTGKAVFEMPVTDPVKGWVLPSGPAAMRQVTLRWDQAGWEIFSAVAARVSVLEGLNSNESGSVILFGPSNPVMIQARPKQRDINAEETKFFSEVSNLFLPGPGVVNGRHSVSIRPAQGRVSSLVMVVPHGFTVSDVIDGPVGSWRFDPEKHELRLPIEPAQDQSFSFIVETQQSAGNLPMNLDLTPLRVTGAAGEIGFMALAFGEEAQSESMKLEGLSRVTPEDFNSALLPRDSEGNPLALLQNAFRYGSGEVAAHVKVAAVAPELRAESWQLVSLGEDRLVVTSDLSVTISRSGVFRLALDVPEGLEIETATGDGLSHWSETNIDGKRVVILNLIGKTIGKCDFNLSMSGRPVGTQEKWLVPRISLREASRETGVLTVVPERGLQVLAVERKNISQMDPRELANAPKDSARAGARPGALAYRLLQGDWSLGLAVSRLNPWVTAQVFHESTLREGQMVTRAAITYKIENAAMKSLRIRIPGLDATAAATVRATGTAVADLVAVASEKDVWEIRFQRGVAGETNVDLEYQRASKDAGSELIQPIVLEGVSQLVYYTAIRAGGRLDLETGVMPRGWQRVDWAVVQSSLGKSAGSVAPLMAFRVADPEGPLSVILKRHELAELQKLRVSAGNLTTLLSPKGDALTSVDLKMQVVGKDTLRLKLPKGAELFNVLVNDEGATLVREGDAWLFYVFPSPEVGQPASVSFVYSAGTTTGKRLEGPILNVPMENLTWRVLVPEGWKMTDHGGDFDLKQQSAMGSFGVEDYQSFVQSKKESDSKSAVALLDQANGWLAAGDQEKASQALSNISRSNKLDAASGEDARIQLRQLKTQQAVLGLNTRRQKLAIDNRVNIGQLENGQLDRAAEANPVLRGGYNYDPKQFNRFLEGNTSDENSALKEIANRIVTQQLAAEPAPVALGVTLPERGTVLTFGRSVQVDGQHTMGITLDLERNGKEFAWSAVILCLLTGAMAGIRREKVC
ncbi:MAG: hypothetical protein H8M99_12030 [Gloeobacteraceae cyanobacterium ES-bin-144]|nr:hypothetical protein [Verrucomicrobiales bacterium]